MNNVVIKIQCIIIFLMVIIICCGCSFNGYGVSGFAERKIYESSTALLIETKSKGINFFSEGSIGLQVGYLERQLIYPVITKNTNLCIEKLFLNTLTFNVKPDKVNYFDSPIHIENKWIGGGLEISSFAITAELGIGNRKATRISSDESFSVQYYNNIKSKKISELCAGITVNKMGKTL